MPSEKILQQKQEIVAGLTEKLQGAVAGVLVDYKGISVADDTVMRRELRNAGVEYTVVKNTLLRLAAHNAGLSELDQVLEGTTALAVSKEDPVAAAKILSTYADKLGKDGFAIKAGFVDGKVLDAKGVEALSKLPSREVLVAQTLAGLNAPISGFVNVLAANMRGLAVALNAIAEKMGA